MKTDHSLNRFLKRQRPLLEERLRKLVEIPTVSADSGRDKQFRQAALLASKFVRESGGESEICATSGNPVVIGRFPARQAHRTLTIYNHLDVQPAEEPEWKQDPFTFRKEGDRYCGRGSTDDKGPALTALLAAHYAKEAKIPLNIQFVWEFEEEIGSPHFEEFLRSKSSDLKCDSVMVVDSIWISRKTPCICYGIRGNLTGSMTLETAKAGVHSGITGGVARNPITELCWVANQCYDIQRDRVLIPGFYDDVQRVSRKEKENFAASGFHLQNWTRAYGLTKTHVKSSEEAMIRLWCRPTFELHGIAGGYTGPKVKTAIPPRAELKFSCRLVPRQHPEKVARFIERYVKRIHPDVQLTFHSKLHWYVGGISGPYARAASEAMRHGFSKAPAFVRSGGSDGAIVLLDRYLKAPIMFLGLSLPEHGYHAPNEYYEWSQVVGGVKSFVRYFDSIARI